MARILIVFGTTQGQTQKIAEFIAEELRQDGHHADVRDSYSLPLLHQIDLYDGFIGGASVHISHFQTSFRDWIRAHSRQINQKPSAFFSVCLGILQKDPMVRAQERNIVRSFLKDTDWEPGFFEIFAGALLYSRYNWFIKRMMRSIARKAGADTDISRNYEYTDWESVRKFAHDFSALFLKEKKNSSAKLELAGIST